MAPSTAVRATRSNALMEVTDYLALYQAPSVDRIRIIKHGVPATDAKRVLSSFSLTQAVLFSALNLSIATINRKALQAKNLNQEESERVLGFAKLIGQIEAITAGADDTEGFDASAWLSQWISEPLPAFGGRKPIDFLDTMEGQNLVSDTLAQMQSGAYA